MFKVYIVYVFVCSLPYFVHYCQVVTDMEKFQELVKEVTLCAYRNCLSGDSKSDPSAYTLTI